MIANRVQPARRRSDPSAELVQTWWASALAAQGLRDLRGRAPPGGARPREPGDLRGRLGRTPLIEVPHLDDDVHDLDGLRRMDEYLFG